MEKDFEYYIALCGIGTAGAFCLLLAFLIYDARNPRMADKWLAATMLCIGILASVNTYRVLTEQYLWYRHINTALWIAIIFTCAVCTYYLIQERRNQHAND